MKTYLAVLLVSFIALSSYAGNKYQRSNPADVSKGQTQQETRPVITSESIPQSNSGQPGERNANPESDGGHYQLYFLLASVVISFATFIVVWRQVATLRQIERAWLMVDIEWLPGLKELHSETTILGESQGKKTTVNVRLIYRNCGQTPAWITEKRAALTIASRLPKTPNFKSTQIEERVLEPMAIGEIKSSDHSITCELPDGSGKSRTVYGIVKYRDAFGAKRKTTFGYARVHDKWERIADPPKYNKHT